MNPYLAFALAMCGIVAIALAGTAYMAIYFNRRAKSDLESALAPLAVAVNGGADPDEARVDGRFADHIASARVAMLPGGMGRVFQTELVDSAGGQGWEWTVSRSKQPGVPVENNVKDVPAGLEPLLAPVIVELVSTPSLTETWFRLDYRPDAGVLRLTRPMKTRRDLPTEEQFRSYLTALVLVADRNREIQQAE